MLYLFRAIVYGTYLLKKRFHGRRDPFKLIPLIQSMTACLNSANETFQMNGSRLLEDAFNSFLPRQAKTIPFNYYFTLSNARRFEASAWERVNWAYPPTSFSINTNLPLAQPGFYASLLQIRSGHLKL